MLTCNYGRNTVKLVNKETEQEYKILKSAPFGNHLLYNYYKNKVPNKL